MAAGQQNRRLNAASVVSNYLQEQYRARKRKNVEPTQKVLKIDSHIDLKWDENRVNPIARREQIGITWRDLDSFIGSAPHRYTPLADVLSLPQEIFELENLTMVLSYEVWETHLSESERDFLTQFLPQGTDREQILHTLLTRENFHFGNPFLKWGASLCSGNLHPDAVLHQEHCFRANKRAYYLELQKYHDDILENLLKLKEIWASNKDPENHVVQKAWRKGFIRDRLGNLLAVTEKQKAIANSKKEEKPQKLGNYMFYFKISRKQHQLVKRMKQSGDGIQSKSLNCVLGDIKSFHVRPYESFEEEERKKLHDYWLLLANRDLPAAFLDWKDRQLKKQQWWCSLEQEMVGKEKHLMEEEEARNYYDSMLDKQEGNGETECCGKNPLGADSHHNTENEPSMDIQSSEDDGMAVPQSGHCQPVEPESLLNGHELDPVETHSEEGSEDILKPEVAPPNLSEFLGNMDPIEDTVLHEVEVSSAKDVRAVACPSDLHCHFHSVSHEYPSANELSLRQPKPIEEWETGLIDLESDMAEQDAEEASQFGPSNFVGPPLYMNNDGSFISYTNQDCNELLQPNFKGQGFLRSYSYEHRQPMLQFLATNDGALENSHLPRHFLEEQQHQQLLLEQRGMREKELYMRQLIQKHMHSSGNSYPLPSRELFPPVRVQDWAIDPQCISTPVQSHLAGEGFLGENWFKDEHRTSGGWSGLDVSSSPGQVLVNGSCEDESLFSMLSQCNKLQSHSYSQIRLTEQYTSGKDFMGGGIMERSDVFPQTDLQLNYLSNDATATDSMKVNNILWMNTQGQSAGLHDSIWKSSFF